MIGAPMLKLPARRGAAPGSAMGVSISEAKFDDEVTAEFLKCKSPMAEWHRAKSAVRQSRMDPFAGIVLLMDAAQEDSQRAIALSNCISVASSRAPAGEVKIGSPVQFRNDGDPLRSARRDAFSSEFQLEKSKSNIQEARFGAGKVSMISHQFQQRIRRDSFGLADGKTASSSCAVPPVLVRVDAVTGAATDAISAATDGARRRNSVGPGSFGPRTAGGLCEGWARPIKEWVAMTDKRGAWIWIAKSLPISGDTVGFLASIYEVRRFGIGARRILRASEHLIDGRSFKEVVAGMYRHERGGGGVAMAGSLLATRRLTTAVVVVRAEGGMARVQIGGTSTNLKGRSGTDRGVSSLAEERGDLKQKRVAVGINSWVMVVGCRRANHQNLVRWISRRKRKCERSCWLLMRKVEVVESRRGT